MNIWLAFLLAAVGAFWVYNDAKNRGINGIPWAVLTFLVLIIGLPLYLLYRPKGSLVECTWCGKKKLDSLRICPHCDSSSRMQAEKVETEPSVGTPERNICNSCGKIIDPDWKYCPYCGCEQKGRWGQA